MGLNMGFYSGFFKKSSILAENAINKNARFSRKKGVMTFLSQKQRGHDFFRTKIKELWKKSDNKFHDPENYVKKFHDPEKDAEKFHDPDNPLRPGVNIIYVNSLIRNSKLKMGNFENLCSNYILVKIAMENIS